MFIFAHLNYNQLHRFSARIGLIAFEILAIIPQTTSYIPIFGLTFSFFNIKTSDTSEFSRSAFSVFCWRIFIWKFMRSCNLSTCKLMLCSSCKAELRTINNQVWITSAFLIHSSNNTVSVKLSSYRNKEFITNQ